MILSFVHPVLTVTTVFHHSGVSWELWALRPFAFNAAYPFYFLVCCSGNKLRHTIPLSRDQTRPRISEIPERESTRSSLELINKIRKQDTIRLVNVWQVAASSAGQISLDNQFCVWVLVPHWINGNQGESQRLKFKKGAWLLKSHDLI